MKSEDAGRFWHRVRPNPAQLLLLRPNTLSDRRRRAPLPPVGARLSCRFLRDFDRESAAGGKAAWRLPSAGLSMIERRETSKFLAARLSTLRAVEIVANDTIVVAGLVPAAPFGDCICARAGGDGRFASALAAAVDMPGTAISARERSGCASS